MCQESGDIIPKAGEVPCLNGRDTAKNHQKMSHRAMEKQYLEVKRFQESISA